MSDLNVNTKEDGGNGGKYSKIITNKKDPTIIDKLNRIIESKMTIFRNHDALIYIDLPRKGKNKHIFMKDNIVRFSKFDKKTLWSYKYNSFYIWLDKPIYKSIILPIVRDSFLNFIKLNQKCCSIRNNIDFLMKILN